MGMSILRSFRGEYIAAVTRFHILPIGALEWKIGADLAPEALEEKSNILDVGRSSVWG
jgi:hypothetical protein